MADAFPDGFAAELGSVSRELERIGDLADGVSRSLSQALRDAIVDGKSLQGVLADVARSFADIALRAALKPVGELAGGLVESLFTATSPVLAGNRLAAPSYFPAHEAWPRAGAAVAGPDVSGSGHPVAAAAAGVSVTLNVTAHDARSFVAAEAEVSAMLLRAVKRGTRSS